MSLPASFLDELRLRVPLSAYIGRQVALQKAGREFKACCPFHNEKSASFYVNDVKGFYHCFGCGAHGDLIGFAMRFNRLEFPEAIETLAREAGLPVPERTKQSKEQVDARARLYAVLEKATEFFTRELFAPTGRQALAYLRGRGLSDETIAAWRLGYAPDDAQALLKFINAAGFTEKELQAVELWRASERGSGGYSFFRGRVMFPVADRRGRVVAFGARLLAGDGPKYINSPEHVLFKKGEMLFGAAMVRQRGYAQPLLLVEGYMDVISLAQAGIAAVAPLGTALTDLQLKALWHTAKSLNDAPPVLCFDGDGAGRRAASRALHIALPQLTSQHTVRFAFLPQGDDPDSLVRNRGAAAMYQVLQQAEPLVDALWAEAQTLHDLQTPEGKAAFSQWVAGALQKIADSATREAYQRELKNREWHLFRQVNNKGARGKIGGAGPALTRLPPEPAQLRREKIFLATLINYPELYDLAEPWLLAQVDKPARNAANMGVASTEAGTASFAPIYAALIKAQTQLDSDAGSGLDAANLASYLEHHFSTMSQNGVRQVALQTLREILSESTYGHAGFARPGGDVIAARHGLQDLLQQAARAEVLADLSAAKVDLANAADTAAQTAAFNRLVALQQALAAMPQLGDDAG